MLSPITLTAFRSELRKIAEAPAKAKSELRQGIEFFDHQPEFIRKLIKQDGQVIASHPVGSGKTLSAIAGFEELRKLGKADRALVVVPAGLRTNFLENGIKKFTHSKGAIFGNSEEVSRGYGHSVDNPDPGARYHVVSYEMFIKEPEKYIQAAGADTVIYDELHRIRNEDGKTMEVVKKVRPLHRNFIGLTGSIVNNSPSDLVPIVDAMTNGKHSLGTKATFERRFVSEADKEGRKELKNPMMVKLLLAPYIHHVDPLTSQAMPKKVVEEVKVDMSDEQKMLYDHVLKKLDPITALKLKFGATKLKTNEIQNIFNQIIQARQVTNAIHTINKSVNLTQSAKRSPKVRKLLDDVEDHLKETPDGQVVVYSNLIHGGVDVLTQGLKDRGIDHAVFVGRGQEGGSEKARTQGVEDYQTGKKRVIVLSSAGKEGLDLRNTTFAAMLDGHFNPEVIQQAEARGVRAGGQSHRPQEKRQVLVRRYMTTVPRNFTATLHEVSKLVSPTMVMERLRQGAPLFYNPLKRERSTDEWIYEVARNKNALNKQLRTNLSKAASLGETLFELEEVDSLEEVHDLCLDVLSEWTFEKFAAFGGTSAKKDPKKAREAAQRIPFQPFRIVKSDRFIMEKYMQEMGRHVEEMADPSTGQLPTAALQQREQQFIDALRTYYREAAKGEPSIFSGKEKSDGDRYKSVAKAFGVSGAVVGGLASLPIVAALVAAKNNPQAAEDILTGAGLPFAAEGLLTGAMLTPAFVQSIREPTYTTPKAMARRANQLQDDEFRKMLRGLSVVKEEVKKHEVYVK